MYVYDGGGSRLKRIVDDGVTTTTTLYVGNVEIEKVNGTEARRTVYYSGAFRIIGGANAGLYYTHGDHLGSVSALSDANGMKVAGSDVVYAPFGEVRAGSQSELTDFGYTRQRHDDSTGGLIYYRARYYLPGIQHFISADTIVPDPVDPQAFNRYSYVLNNPIKLIDPTGHAYACNDSMTRKECQQAQHATRPQLQAMYQQITVREIITQAVCEWNPQYCRGNGGNHNGYRRPGNNPGNSGNSGGGMPDFTDPNVAQAIIDLVEHEAQKPPPTPTKCTYHRCPGALEDMIDDYGGTDMHLPHDAFVWGRRVLVTGRIYDAATLGAPIKPIPSPTILGITLALDFFPCQVGASSGPDCLASATVDLGVFALSAVAAAAMTLTPLGPAGGAATYLIASSALSDAANRAGVKERLVDFYEDPCAHGVACDASQVPKPPQLGTSGIY